MKLLSLLVVGAALITSTVVLADNELPYGTYKGKTLSGRNCTVLADPVMHSCGSDCQIETGLDVTIADETSHHFEYFRGRLEQSARLQARMRDGELTHVRILDNVCTHLRKVSHSVQY